MKKKFNICILFLLSYSFFTAQVKISDGTSGDVNTESVLQLESVGGNKGLLLPRVALQATNISTPISSHIRGLVVFNTASQGTSPNNVTPGLYYNDGTKWVKMTTKSARIGDIKNGFQADDHNGWFKLDGRLITDLPSKARNNAISLGFSTTIPDARDRFSKMNNGSETTAATSGSDSFVIAQANLPVFTMNGNALAAGAHTHTYVDNPTTQNNNASGSNNPIANNSSVNSTTTTNGAHTHKVEFSLGGSSSPVELKPAHVNTNVFIYLGS